MISFWPVNCTRTRVSTPLPCTQFARIHSMYSPPECTVCTNTFVYTPMSYSLFRMLLVCQWLARVHVVARVRAVCPNTSKFDCPGYIVLPECANTSARVHTRILSTGQRLILHVFSVFFVIFWGSLNSSRFAHPHQPAEGNLYGKWIWLVYVCVWDEFR